MGFATDYLDNGSSPAVDELTHQQVELANRCNAGELDAADFMAQYNRLERKVEAILFWVNAKFIPKEATLAEVDAFIASRSPLSDRAIMARWR